MRTRSTRLLWRLPRTKVESFDKVSQRVDAFFSGTSTRSKRSSHRLGGRVPKLVLAWQALARATFSLSKARLTKSWRQFDAPPSDSCGGTVLSPHLDCG